MRQLSLFESVNRVNAQIERASELPDKERFDRRKRSYETDEAYARRLEMIEAAFRTDYYTSKWISISNWAEICPTGAGNRVPKDKRKLGDETCFHLTLHDISPEDFTLPLRLTRQIARELPARATYVAKPNDVCYCRDSRNR